MNKRKPTVEEVLRKHSGRIENRMQVTPKKINYSQAYTKFKKELSPELTRYEKWCHSLGNVIKLKVSKKDEDRSEEHTSELQSHSFISYAVFCLKKKKKKQYKTR